MQWSNSPRFERSERGSRPLMPPSGCHASRPRVAASLSRPSARPTSHLDPWEHQARGADDNGTDPDAGTGQRVILRRQWVGEDPQAQTKEDEAANRRTHNEPSETPVSGVHGHGRDATHRRVQSSGRPRREFTCRPRVVLPMSMRHTYHRGACGRCSIPPGPLPGPRNSRTAAQRVQVRSVPGPPSETRGPQR